MSMILYIIGAIKRMKPCGDMNRFLTGKARWGGIKKDLPGILIQLFY